MGKQGSKALNVLFHVADGIPETVILDHGLGERFHAVNNRSVVPVENFADFGIRHGTQFPHKEAGHFSSQNHFLVLSLAGDFVGGHGIERGNFFQYHICRGIEAGPLFENILDEAITIIFSFKLNLTF